MHDVTLGSIIFVKVCEAVFYIIYHFICAGVYLVFILIYFPRLYIIFLGLGVFQVICN
jgi:hypothetical protein